MKKTKTRKAERSLEAARSCPWDSKRPRWIFFIKNQPLPLCCVGSAEWGLMLRTNVRGRCKMEDFDICDNILRGYFLMKYYKTVEKKDGNLYYLRY